MAGSVAFAGAILDASILTHWPVAVAIARCDGLIQLAGEVSCQSGIESSRGASFAEQTRVLGAQMNGSAWLLWRMKPGLLLKRKAAWLRTIGCA